jgi:hypothetical protein
MPIPFRIVKRAACQSLALLSLIGVGRAQQTGAATATSATAPTVFFGSPKAGGTPLSGAGSADKDSGKTLNDLIVQIVRTTMPRGGNYSIRRDSFIALQSAIGTDHNGHLELRPELAKPSFCSGATYLVLLSVLDELNRQGRLPLKDDVISALQMKNQADGFGVWGRWNANGPGTARLFAELEMGRSFTSFDEARAGDFLKLFWNENIGSTERGHSVIYWGRSADENGQVMITFWSANMPDGFGLKTIPISRVKRALFTRLENPRAILDVATRLPAKDAYLAEIRVRPSSEREMYEKVGITVSPSLRASSNSAPETAPAKHPPDGSLPKKATPPKTAHSAHSKKATPNPKATPVAAQEKKKSPSN